MTHVPSRIEERLAAVEKALTRLGVNIDQSMRHVDSTPAVTCINNGVVVEAILRDLWKRLGIKGPPSKRQLEDLVTATTRKLEEEDRPMPRRIHDYIRAIQLTRNRAAHHMDATVEDAAESLRQLSDVSYWYFVEFLGQRQCEANADHSDRHEEAAATADVSREDAAPDEPDRAAIPEDVRPQIPPSRDSALGVKPVDELVVDAAITPIPPGMATQPAPTAAGNPFAATACGPAGGDGHPQALLPPAPGSENAAHRPWVLALSALHFAMAAISAAGGLLMLLGRFVSSSHGDGRSDSSSSFLVTVFLVVPPCLFAGAFATVGVGIQRRRRWGLTSARSLAAFGLLLALVMVCVTYIPALIAVFYFAVVWAVSLRKSLAAQFSG